MAKSNIISSSSGCSHIIGVQDGSLLKSMKYIYSIDS